jgi:signal transduction histidine kinase/ActR/RegA family two-component response regulator
MAQTSTLEIQQILRNLPSGTHMCHLFETPGDLTDVLVPYFASGLERGEVCLWIVDGAISVDDARHALSREVGNLAPFIDAHRLEFHDHDQWYRPEGRFCTQSLLARYVQKEQSALAAGFKGLRITGNTSWLRDEMWSEFLSYERHVDTCLCERAVSAICTYPLERCTASEVMDVAQSHEVALIRRRGEWKLLESASLRAARKQLLQSRDRLQALAGRLIDAEQRERTRISRVLHDGLQQTIVAAKMTLARAMGQDGPGRNDILSRVDGLLAESIQECRTLTTEISPPVLHGGTMTAILEWLAAWFAQRHDLSVNLLLQCHEPALNERQRVLLYDAARELLFNVVKHARVGAASLHLREMDDRLNMTVFDTGVGCDLLKTTGQVDPHFGLLRLRERLRLESAELTLTSAPGQGFTAIVSVPLHQAPRRAVPAAGQEAALAARAQVSDALRILLVDDHPIVRQGLAMLLDSHPGLCVVGEAGDGVAAVSMARGLQPDVVLMDINLPGIDGIEATRRICADRAGVRVIGLSMHDQPQMVQAMLHAGAEAYLPKDGPADRLIHAIHTRPGAAQTPAGECRPSLSN